MSEPNDGAPEPQTWLEHPASIYRVLHVEDSAADAALAAAMLTANNSDRYHIEHLTRRADAITRLRDAESPRLDVILLDLGLPDSQHLETLQGVLAFSGEVPVVVLTVQEEEHMGRGAVAAGADDYLCKTEMAVPNLLARTLRYAIARGRRRQEQRAHEADAPARFEPLPAVAWSAQKAERPGLRIAEPVLFRQLLERWRGLLLHPADLSAGGSSAAIRTPTANTGAVVRDPSGDAEEAEIQQILEQLIEHAATPADLIDLHSAALQRAIDDLPNYAQVIAERARGLALNMMARLAILYRARQ